MNQQLVELVGQMKAGFVLTGAGLSTASGIPDYRDENRQWKHQQPMQFQEFVASEAARQRYWARSAVGWQRIQQLSPNTGHEAIVDLQELNKLSLLVTQNVDGLHQRAGSKNIVDLHGNLEKVVCVACGHREDREIVQQWMMRMNPQLATAASLPAPDGDAFLENIDTSRIFAPCCTNCDGALKPDVVFFGENVPKPRVQACFDALEKSDVMLVIGSSLSVFSGLRFVRQAKQRKIPIAMINKGKSRADELVDIKVEEDCNELLPLLIKQFKG